jgi:hypothetical protein
LSGILTINSDSTKFYNTCHIFLDPFSKLWDLDSRLGAAGYVSSMTCFSNLFAATKTEDYSQLEHLTASRQPRKYSEDTFKMEFQKNSMIPSKVLGSWHYSATKSSGACQG